MNYNARIYVAGHLGMVGSAIHRYLLKQGFNNIITAKRSELDLTNQKAVSDFFSREKPEKVYLAAAKVGGINSTIKYPAEFIYENMMIEANIIHHSFLHGVKRLLFLGSSCIYPKLAEQPMEESALLTGKLEPTNEPYSIAKIAGIKLCESYNRQFGASHGVDYRSVMPTNLYGPGDSYHLDNGHVVPALIRKIHEAKVNKSDYVSIWGSGIARREFLYVDDMASASVFIMSLDKMYYDHHTEVMQSHINVGFGDDISILDLAKKISKVIGYEGKIGVDESQPTGCIRKLMDSTKINQLGWYPEYDLDHGLKITYENFKSNISTYSV